MSVKKTNEKGQGASIMSALGAVAIKGEFEFPGRTCTADHQGNGKGPG